jgi:hypothetical protein
MLDYKDMTFAELAAVIKADWKKPYFGAVPYLEALSELNTTDPKAPYFFEDAKTQVIYFLSNASGWRGEVAKAVKLELNRRYKNA